MTDLPNDMWLAVAGKLLKNLDILTAHPTRQSLAHALVSRVTGCIDGSCQ